MDPHPPAQLHPLVHSCALGLSSVLVSNLNSTSTSTSTSTSWSCLPDDLLAYVFTFVPLRELAIAHQLNHACQIMCCAPVYWLTQFRHWFGARYMPPPDDMKQHEQHQGKTELSQVPIYILFRSLWLIFHDLPRRLTHLTHAQRILRAEAVGYIRQHAVELEPLLCRTEPPVAHQQQAQAQTQTQTRTPRSSTSMSSISSAELPNDTDIPHVVSRLALPAVSSREWQHFVGLLSEARVNQLWYELSTIEPAKRMEYGATLVARAEYPWLTTQQISHELTVIAGRVQDEMDDGSVGHTLRARLQLLNRVMFEEFEFRGNERDYYSPANSCINRVLATRLGIPISLSVVYMCVASRVGIDVQGMNTPAHFLMRAHQGDELYYIDAFNGGRLMSPMETIHFLNHAVSPADLQSQVCSDPPYELFLRMYNNLINVYRGPPLLAELGDRHSISRASSIHHCSSQMMVLLELSGSPPRPAQQAFLNRFRVDALVATDPAPT